MTNADDWTVNDQHRQELLDGGRFPDEGQGSGSWSRVAAAVVGAGRGVENLAKMQTDQFKLDEEELIRRASLAVPEGAALSQVLELAEGLKRGLKEHGTEESTQAQQEALVESIMTGWASDQRAEDELLGDKDK